MYEQQVAPQRGYSAETDWSTRRGRPTAVIHYTIYLPDGHSISSHETGHPFRFHMEAGHVIPGLEQAIASMEVGETRRIQLTPRQAFGEHRKDRVLLADYDHIFSPVELHPGQPVRLSRRNGADRPGGLEQAFVREKIREGIIFDLNHPLAGLDLTIDVTLMAVE